MTHSPKTIAEDFLVVRKIDQGTFSSVFLALNVKDNSEVVVKLEPRQNSFPQLIYECKLYNYLHKDPEVVDKGISSIHHSGTEGNFNFLVMEKLGLNLQYLFDSVFRRFSLKTVLMLMDQMISNVEYLHSRKILHRDIKPHNFCMGGLKNSSKVYLIDLGNAKKFIKKDGTHIPFRDGRNLAGCPRFASLNGHLGLQNARRDDMESLGFIAVYFMKGKLPWQGVRSKNRRDRNWDVIKEAKLKTTSQDLCEGLPAEFQIYLNHCRSLKFDETPDYQGMRKLFHDLFLRQNFIFDFEYDWILMEKDDKRSWKMIL